MISIEVFCRTNLFILDPRFHGDDKGGKLILTTRTSYILLTF